MVHQSGKAVQAIRALCFEEGWEVASLAEQVLLKWMPGLTDVLPEAADRNARCR